MMTIPSIAPKSDEGFRPVDPKTFKWEPGSVVRVTTVLNQSWCPITFNLTLVKPVGFEELKALVTKALRDSVSDQHKNLFAEWYHQAQQLGMVDAESFKKAAKDVRAKDD